MKWIDSFIAWLEKVLRWDKTVPSLDHITEVPITPKPMTNEMTNTQKLYAVALGSIGKDMSPLDRAPDSLGCMESLDGVYFACFGEHLLSLENRLSTELGYQAMILDPRLEKIDIPEAGDIVISPTGYSKKGFSHGHTGIWGKYDVMSNDSASGLWRDNYTHEAWYTVFGTTLGFPIYFFRVRG